MFLRHIGGGAKQLGRVRGHTYIFILVKSWRNPQSKKNIASVFVKFLFNRRLDNFCELICSFFDFRPLSLITNV